MTQAHTQRYFVGYGKGEGRAVMVVGQEARKGSLSASDECAAVRAHVFYKDGQGTLHGYDASQHVLPLNEGGDGVKLDEFGFVEDGFGLLQAASSLQSALLNLSNAREALRKSEAKAGTGFRILPLHEAEAWATDAQERVYEAYTALFAFVPEMSEQEKQEAGE